LNRPGFASCMPRKGARRANDSGSLRARALAIFAKLPRHSRCCKVTGSGMWLAFCCSHFRQGGGMPSGYYRIGLLLLLLSALDALAAPLITAATLFAAATALGVEFTQPYLLLAILAALL